MDKITGREALYPTEIDSQDCRGINIRQHIATHALAALLSNPNVDQTKPAQIVFLSVTYADILIDKLNQQS